MTFVFPLLLGSLAFIGIPVLIHLIMRHKPKKLQFPAFRFLMPRQRLRMRKLRLRHLVLLALRIVLIACIGLALARPLVSLQGFGVHGRRPVAAVIVFDTSFSMEYRTSASVSRLDEAKKRCLELIEQLPEGSQVAVFDTAEVPPSGRNPWYQSLAQVRDRINGMQLRTANGPVSQRLDSAYHLLADLAFDKEDARARKLPRLIFIFSDRTRACWDVSKNASLNEASDLVPPHFTGLQNARADLPNLVELLRELRTQIPVQLGQDYPEQTLIDELEQLKELLPRVTPEDLPPTVELAKVINGVRRGIRDLADALARHAGTEDSPSGTRDYRDRLLAGLTALRRNLAGSEAFFMDVGIDDPVDVTLLEVKVINEESRLEIRARVQATGKPVSSTLRLQVDKKTIDRALDMKAGQEELVPFELNPGDFGPGQHAVELSVVTNDLLPANNSRFATFAVRKPRPVLVLADKVQQADELVHALKAAQFTPHALPATAPLAAGDLRNYHAVYLLGLARPSEPLWQALEEYVAKGGGLAIVPGGKDMDVNAYNQGPAQNILPGTWQELLVRPEKPAVWNLRQDSIFQHPLLRPFRDFRNNKNIDFILQPREASIYWDVRPQAKEMVLVYYADERNRPALLERLPEGKHDRPGKVLMFTTALDPRQPAWNNYLENLSSFYPILIALCTDYLAGQVEAEQLNFVCGQDEPKVPLPISPRYSAYFLSGPNTSEEVWPKDGANTLVLKQAEMPGNYTVTGLPVETSKFTARFSVNLPAEESDLTRVPAAEIEAVLGPGSILALDQQLDLDKILEGQWSEPAEMLPYLLIVVLVALALENLLANRFYRREDEGDPNHLHAAG